jgi:hypothetical protein
MRGGYRFLEKDHAQEINGAIVYWLGYLTLYQVERDRYPLALPTAHVTDAGYEPVIRKRSCKWGFESSRARQILQGEARGEESRAWNAEAGGQNTAP